MPSFFRLLSFVLRLLSLSFSLSFVINLSSLNSFPIGGSLRIAHLDYIMPKSAEPPCCTAFANVHGSEECYHPFYIDIRKTLARTICFNNIPALLVA
ncbi:hypothetical protein BGZ57DRAFT_889067 [Hyaloscypha finlandica]|nr:hypothetical protein BGZ57DRAFT_889067 [Hyaloscypha finlandica]